MIKEAWLILSCNILVGCLLGLGFIKLLENYARRAMSQQIGQFHNHTILNKPVALLAKPTPLFMLAPVNHRTAPLPVTS